MLQLHKLPGGSRNEAVYKAVNPFTFKCEEIVFLLTHLTSLKQFETAFKAQLDTLG